MPPFLARILKLAIASVFCVVVGGFLILGALFFWRMSDMQRPTVSFDAPGGGWTITLAEMKFSETFFQKSAQLEVHRGPMRGHTLLCRMDQSLADREVFHAITSTRWRDGDLKLDWTAGSPPVSGTIDISAICSDSAVFDHRPSLTSLRFHESCLVAGCARWIEWIDTAGGTKTSTPCRTEAAGDDPVFTVGGDVRGQIEVDFDPKARTATWRSRSTGQSGRVAFDTDCDTSRQGRAPAPA